MGNPVTQGDREVLHGTGMRDQWGVDGVTLSHLVLTEMWGGAGRMVRTDGMGLVGEEGVGGLQMGGGQPRIEVKENEWIGWTSGRN